MTLRSVGRIETGHVAEQRVQVRDAQGGAHLFRRIRVKLDQATRDGDRVLYILTNVPLRKASAKRVARLYRKRWTLETAFQHLEAYFHSEINTLGYPKAALFGFCLALVAYNMLAVVMAALRSVHGAETIDQELSLYYVANDIAQTYHGMMIAIPEDEWRVFSRMRPAEMVATLRALAQKVRLKAYRKSPRGPKKPRPKREGTTKVVPCLHRQTTQESKSQCGDTLTGLASRVIFTSFNAMRVPGLLHAPKASRRKVSPFHVATVLWAGRHP